MSDRGVREMAKLIDREAASAAVVPLDRARAKRAAHASEWADDVLRTIDPPTYVEALVGAHVPPSGVIHCPLPGHRDRTPSFKVYPDAEQGVWCFGCGRGGSIYDFAAALWGIEPHGAGFHELRREIARRLLGTVA